MRKLAGVLDCANPEVFFGSGAMQIEDKLIGIVVITRNGGGPLVVDLGFESAGGSYGELGDEFDRAVKTR